MPQSKAQSVTGVASDLEIAMINAAVQLTLGTTSKLSADVDRQYRGFYAAIVEEYNKVH